MSLIRVWSSDAKKSEIINSLEKKQPKSIVKVNRKHPEIVKSESTFKVTRPVKDNAPELKTPVERIRVVLKPTAGQKMALGEMFDAPQALAKLLLVHPIKIRSLRDASFFLLQNRKVLDGFINPLARTESIELLTEMLMQWSEDPPDLIGIDFVTNCSISTQQEIYLPINGFRCIAILDPAALIGKRLGSQYEGPFTLFREGKCFVVTFNLVKNLAVTKLSENLAVKTAKPKVNKSKKFIVPELILLPGSKKPYISGLRNQKSEPRRRVLYTNFSQVFGGGMRTMNWGGLSGWGVNGGLPSLGKNSR